MADEQLSPELTKELNELLQLPEKEQQGKLQSFLKKLTPGQIESLKKSQGPEQCPFCLIGEGKIESFTVYEDSELKGVLDIHPATKGHVLLFPKKHYTILSTMEEKEIAHLFTVANKISVALYDGIKAEGSALYTPNGVVAGQNIAHVIVHVIPRFKNDKVKFAWEHLQFDKDEMEKVAQQIKSNIKFEKKVYKEEMKEISYTDFDERLP